MLARHNLALVRRIGYNLMSNFMLFFAYLFSLLVWVVSKTSYAIEAIPNYMFFYRLWSFLDDMQVAASRSLTRCGMWFKQRGVQYSFQSIFPGCFIEVTFKR